MNYSSVIFVFVMGASVLYYQLRARHWFTGPGNNIELPADSYVVDPHHLVMNEKLHQHSFGYKQDVTDEYHEFIHDAPVKELDHSGHSSSSTTVDITEKKKKIEIGVY
jgi:hypothetical protein